MAIGPVQLLVVAFDEPHFTGAIVEELNRLRDHDLVRLLDVLVVQKDLDGDVTAVQLSDLSIGEAEELGAKIGALIGIGFDGEDGMEAGASRRRRGWSRRSSDPRQRDVRRRRLDPAR